MSTTAATEAEDENMGLQGIPTVPKMGLGTLQVDQSAALANGPFQPTSVAIPSMEPTTPTNSRVSAFTTSTDENSPYAAPPKPVDGANPGRGCAHVAALLRTKTVV